MRKKTILYLTILFIFSFGLIIYSCNDVENNLVTAPDIGPHPSGWLNPSSPNFHGASISAHNWDMSFCKKCHGMDYKGGGSGAACTKCHPNTPEDCHTCHGNSMHIYPPNALNGSSSISYIGVGVHDTHLGDSTLRISRGLHCLDCHKHFNGFSDTAHINPNRGGSIALVVFDTLARTITGGITPNPVWNRTTATCSSVYCHGDFKNGNYRLLNPPPLPVWTNPESVHCGTCHGNPNTGDPCPGGDHSVYTINQCWWCHPRVIDTNGVIYNKSLHIDGIVEQGQRK